MRYGLTLEPKVDLLINTAMALYLVIKWHGHKDKVNCRSYEGKTSKHVYLSTSGRRGSGGRG